MTAANILRWHIMTPLLHSGGNPFDCQLGRGQPQPVKAYPVTFFAHGPEQNGMVSPRKGSFKRKILALLDQFFQAREEQFSCPRFFSLWREG